MGFGGFSIVFGKELLNLPAKVVPICLKIAILLTFYFITTIKWQLLFGAFSRTTTDILTVIAAPKVVFFIFKT